MQRDRDLQGPDFFDAAKYPEIVFKSTAVRRTGDSVVVTGDLTMKGVTKPVTLRGTFNGYLRPGPRLVAGFEVTGTLKRTEWGVVWNRALEGGGALLGDEVALTIAIEALGPFLARKP